MSTLTLVRHGQAAAFEKITDKLSEYGEVQARKLAEHWIRQGIAFDQVYCGSLERQRSTAEVARATYERVGIAWPAVQIVEALNEYDANGILTRLAPKIAEADSSFCELQAAAAAAVGTPDYNRHFQRMFEAAVKRWMEGSAADPEVESWRDFRARVRGAIERILEGAGNRRVVVFSSGGPIAVTMQMALEMPDSAALALHWRIRNCSVTEFLFSPGRFTLDCFNTIPHLEEAALRTFR